MKPIFLSAGHSDTDPGAIAFGRTEADIVVDFRNLISFYLMRAKLDHELDGEGTENLPLAQTVKRTQRMTGIELEFHCNSVADPRANGVETLSGREHMALGAKICDAISRGLGIRNRGAKPENAGQHHRLAFAQAGGIIVETFFLSNANDLAAYDARRWLAAKYVSEVIIAEAAK